MIMKILRAKILLNNLCKIKKLILKKMKYKNQNPQKYFKEI